MRYAVLGDVHGNFHALEAVLSDIDKDHVDGILCVGDIVGYGANPVECIRALMDRKAVVVAGNHDWGALGRTSVEFFNADAKDSILWTQSRLSARESEYIGAMPLVLEDTDFTLVHGTLYCPEYFDYIHTLYDAHLTFASLKTPVCFLGHSHIPIVFFSGNPISYYLETEIDLTESAKTIVNVGSVGQPRDLDPRACYAVYDHAESKVNMKRVLYDVEAAQQAIEREGLPAMNGTRLALGR